MIVGNIKELMRYRFLGENLAKAIDYLAGTDLREVPPGRIEIDGDDVYLIIQHYDTKPYADGRYESHEAYIDIQYMIEGREEEYTACRDCFAPSGPYDPRQDKTNYEESDMVSRIVLSAGMSAVYFPEDVHKPCICTGGRSEPVKKALAKVRV